MKKIFIDAKYSNSDPLTQKPISIAFIVLETDERAYLEFSDYDIDECTPEIKQLVLPKLKGNSTITTLEGMHFFSHWLEKQGESIIIGESIDDFNTIKKYMKVPDNLIQFYFLAQVVAGELNISSEETLEECMAYIQKIKNIYFETHEASTHNAADDADATSYAYSKLITDPLLRRTIK